MKKILFTILAAAAMSAACTKFAEDVVPQYDTVGAPLVEANVCGDDSLTVIITAGANTHYYGYVVVEGTLEGVAADKLAANGYAKAANVVLQGEENAPQSAYYKYSEETKADTLYLSGLTPFTDYTVYAAAVSPMGVLSEVVAVTKKTTDGTQPIVNIDGAQFEEADSVLTFAIPFSDPVALTGKGTAKAYFYAENYYDPSGYLTVYKEVEIPETHMATSGNYLLLAVPADEYIPGAMVSVTYSAGIVVNGADGKNAAFDNHLMAYTSTGLQWDGIVGQYEYVNWDFSVVDPATLPDVEEGEGDMEGEEEEEEEEEKIPVYFSDWTSLYMINYTTSKYPLSSYTSDADVTIWTTESNGRTVSYTGKSYGVATDEIAVVMLDEAPAFGSSVSYTIAEGSFCDIFGNVNNEFTAEDEYFCSYGYSLEDILGSYVYTAESAYGYGTQSGTMTIVASDNPEKGNVMFTEMYSTPCIKNVYANFDMVVGTLTIPSVQLYGMNEEYLFVFCASDNSGQISTDNVTFAVPQAGLFNGQSGYFGDAAFDLEGSPLGFFDVYYGFQAQRATAAPAAAACKAAAKANTRSIVKGQF